MKCIDVRAKARRLGVRYEDAQVGRLKVRHALEDWRKKNGLVSPPAEVRAEAVRSLPHNEMIAVIRMDRYDKHYPEYFTRDGIKE